MGIGYRGRMTVTREFREELPCFRGLRSCAATGEFRELWESVTEVDGGDAGSFGKDCVVFRGAGVARGGEFPELWESVSEARRRLRRGAARSAPIAYYCLAGSCFFAKISHG